MKTKIVSTAELAEILGITPRRVQQLAADGIIRRRNGGFDLAEASRAYIEFLRNEGPGGDKTAYLAERSRLLRAQAELAEIELAEKRGEVASIKEMFDVWEKHLVAFRQRTLAIPTKLAAVLAAEDAPNAVRKILEIEIHEALTELSRWKSGDDEEAGDNESED